MKQEKLRRENWIDAAKVIAILIVVLNHSGMVIPGVNFWGGMFYVPAFFLLAGYTYAHKEESFGSFVKRKAKRLLLPYFTANGVLFLFFFAKDLLTGSFEPGRTLLSLAGIFYGRTQLLKTEGSLVVFEAPMPNVHMMLNLNAPTWFLPALFLVLISAEGLYRLLKKSARRVYLFVAVLAFLMLINHYLSPFLLPWCLDILPYLLVFFLVGIELKKKRFFEWLESRTRPVRYGLVAGILLLTVASGLFNGSFNLSISFFGKSVAICLIAAIGSSVLLLSVLWWLDKKAAVVTTFIGRLSKYNMTILCYHYFVMQMFFAAAGAVLPNVWNEKEMLQNMIRLAGMVVSVLVCVIGDWAYHKVLKK